MVVMTRAQKRAVKRGQPRGTAVSGPCPPDPTHSSYSTTENISYGHDRFIASASSIENEDHYEAPRTSRLTFVSWRFRVFVLSILGSVWRILRRLYRKAGYMFRKVTADDYRRTIEIAFEIRDARGLISEQHRYAKGTLDTGTKYNFISLELFHLYQNVQSICYENLPEVVGLEGRRIKPLGTVEARWAAHGSSRFYKSKFLICENGYFDVIIGLDTIIQLELSRGLSPAFPGLRTELPEVNKLTNPSHQAAQDARSASNAADKRNRHSSNKTKPTDQTKSK